MVARLGIVLYWAGCFVAGVIAIIYGYVFVTEGGDAPLVVFAVFLALVSWLLGRAARYVLAGF